MRRTYAPNAIIVGGLLGLLVYLKTGAGAGITVGIIATVIIWIVIRAIENAVQKGADAIDNAIKRNRNQGSQAQNTSSSLARLHAVSNGQSAPQYWVCPDCGETNSNNSSNCKGCGRYK